MNWLKRLHLPAREKRMTWATRITLVRLCLVPVITWSVWCACWRLAGGAFLVAVATDFIDGYIARAYHEQTVLGAVLDALADKVLMGCVLITILLMPLPVMVPSWALWVILIKELLVMIGAGALIGWAGMQVIAPPIWAKMSGAGGMVVIAWSLLASGYGFTVPTFVVVGVVGLALVSCVAYAVRVVTQRFNRAQSA